MRVPRRHPQVRLFSLWDGSVHLFEHLESPGTPKTRHGSEGVVASVAEAHFQVQKKDFGRQPGKERGESPKLRRSATADGDRRVFRHRLAAPTQQATSSISHVDGFITAQLETRQLTAYRLGMGSPWLKISCGEA